MKPVRVLVVDDSAAIRSVISKALAQEDGIEVVATAANGRIALDKLDRVGPDLVTLDIEMPVLDGLDTLRELRKRRATLPVIMFSTLTARGASATLEALSRGASDYVTKPQQTGGLDGAMQEVRSELAPRIRALTGRRLVPRRPAPSAPVVGKSGPRPPVQRIDLLAVGASTGGPNALTEVVRGLGHDLAVPVVVVQHMPPLFTALLAERLTKLGGIPFREAVDNAPLIAGEGWIAPGDHHVEVVTSGGGPRLRLHQGPPENSCRPAVDVLFRSAAAALGPHVLGVVLTGMGEDGMRGAGDIVAAGGRVLAQDEHTSVVWGMPGAVARRGLADRTLPLDQISGAIDQCVGKHRTGGRPPAVRGARS